VPHEFTGNDGSLTPNPKLRRKVIEERYRKQRDELYAEAEKAPRNRPPKRTRRRNREEDKAVGRSSTVRCARNMCIRDGRR